MSDVKPKPEAEVYAVGGTYLAVKGRTWEVAAECDKCGWKGTITMRLGALVNHYRHKCGGLILLGTAEERAETVAMLRTLRKEMGTW